MRINLENAKVIKTVKGFGGSACWWSPQVKSEKTAHEIANLLYGDDGLRMNIYRFNVGGGYEKYESGDLHWLHKAISNLKAFLLGTYHGRCTQFQAYLANMLSI